MRNMIAFHKLLCTGRESTQENGNAQSELHGENWYQDYYREHSTVQVKPQSAYPIGEKIEHQMAENAFMQEARADALEQMKKHGFNDVKMDDFEPSLIKTVRFSKVGDQEI